MYLLSCQQLIELLGMCQWPQKVHVGPRHPAREPFLLSKRRHEAGSEAGSLPVHELQVLLLEAAVLLAVGSRVLFQLRHPLLQKDNLGNGRGKGQPTPCSPPHKATLAAGALAGARTWLSYLNGDGCHWKKPCLCSKHPFTLWFLSVSCLPSRSTGPNASLFPFFTTRY